MDVNAGMRQLAKTDYYQMLYSHSKDLNLQMFDNTNNYTDIQIKFLGKVSSYSVLLTDVALGDVGEIVLKDDIYQEAWEYYKYKKHDKKLMNSMKKDPKKEVIGENTWVFKRPKK